MRLLHYLEILNFKRFGDRQRIELDHPTVLIGPNNCGKTTAIQAIALWSHAVRAWQKSKGKAPPKKRTATSVNRLGLLAVPVPRTRDFWHNREVRRANENIPLDITLGVLHDGNVKPVTMRFRNQGDDLIYCTPDEDTLEAPEVIETASRLNVRLLYPMSGIETEEPVLQPGRVDVLLGQGQTGQVLRNLCLAVHTSESDDWTEVASLMRRLFSVELDTPRETARGSIALAYRQAGVRDPLDITLAGRGMQQMLLILAYLYSHPGSVLVIDEPDAHLEILRQRQVYVLLYEVAARKESQVILVTHSEMILGEALDHNLTLLLAGRTSDLAAKSDIRNALEHYGTEAYLRALQYGHVFYVEGRTDITTLRALARRLDHAAAKALEERINTYYVRDNFPEPTVDSGLARVEASFGETPKEHFFAIRSMVPALRGLAVLDSNGHGHQDSDEGDLQITYWCRYEIENYFITPETLIRYAETAHSGKPLFEGFQTEIAETLDELVLERVFPDDAGDFDAWKQLEPKLARVLWNHATEKIKLSDFAEEFFRRLAKRTGGPMLLRKSELHRLVHLVDPPSLPEEVSEKLDLLFALLDGANEAPET